MRTKRMMKKKKKKKKKKMKIKRTKMPAELPAFDKFNLVFSF